jgi:hypothetical protein
VASLKEGHIEAPAEAAEAAEGGEGAEGGAEGGAGVPAKGSGLTTAALVEAGGVGVAVERGPDWYENDQDGGIGNTGVVLGYLDGDGEEHGEYGEIGLLRHDCANVKWDGRGDTAYHYSMGCDKDHEFELSLSKVKGAEGGAGGGAEGAEGGGGEGKEGKE